MVNGGAGGRDSGSQRADNFGSDVLATDAGSIPSGKTAVVAKKFAAAADCRAVVREVSLPVAGLRNSMALRMEAESEAINGTSDIPFQAVSLGQDIRPQFPIFGNYLRSNGQALHYLDSAASSQKHFSVIERMHSFLSCEYSNIHRGTYQLSAGATDAYEAVRSKAARLIGAADQKSIVFTRGTTESINLVARSLEYYFRPGDVILISMLEHHSNIVPWQQLAARRGVVLEYCDIGNDAEFDIEKFETCLRLKRPRLAAISHVANSFGTLIPISDVAILCRKYSAHLLVDAAQSVAHKAINVAELQPDFAAFSGHKIYGPTGAGVLYINPRMFGHMEPFMGGGDMIKTVMVNGSTWADPPHCFEAGTPPIAEVIALGQAIDFLLATGLSRIEQHERHVFEEARHLLQSEEGVILYGPANCSAEQTGIIAFNVDGVHPHDLATVADKYGVQIRAGHHCAMPTLRRLRISSSARASIGVYSCIEDFEALLEAIRHARAMFLV